MAGIGDRCAPTSAWPQKFVIQTRVPNQILFNSRPSSHQPPASPTTGPYKRFLRTQHARIFKFSLFQTPLTQEGISPFAPQYPQRLVFVSSPPPPVRGSKRGQLLNGQRNILKNRFHLPKGGMMSARTGEGGADGKCRRSPSTRALERSRR